MIEKPVISIIIPVYNIEKHISDCLDSILAQTVKDIEVIIVNDGSTDKSAEICDVYAEKDRRIKVIHQSKQGVSAARNAGIKRAKGDFIGFVDGDDYIRQKMYENLYEACINTNSSIAINRLGREVNGELINDVTEHFTKEMANEVAMSELFKGILYRFSLCNKLFSRHCFEGITFPVGRIHEDLSTTYRLFANAKKSVYLNEVGYIYVKRKNSILTASYYEKRLEAFIGWDEIITFMHQHYPHLSNEVNSCFTYNCVDHFYYILKQVEDKKARNSYLERIQSSIRKYYYVTRKNNALSFRYKSLVTLIYLNVGLFIMLSRLRKEN